ncbi:MAG: hypothetical protein GWP59_08185 [Chlamydiales bacterium]|nr:hypothetical protein [Chlamydiales bacterium]NCF71663.1 hypothetical protein [Chlamydiales bacterium]
MLKRNLSLLTTCSLIVAAGLSLGSCNRNTADNQSNSVIEKPAAQSFSFKNFFSFSSTSAIDMLSEEERNNLSKNYPETFTNLGNKKALSTEDIIALTHITIEEKVLQIIHDSKGEYQLDAKRIISLKDKGVSNLVIHRMMRKNKEQASS